MNRPENELYQRSGVSDVQSGQGGQENVRSSSVFEGIHKQSLRHISQLTSQLFDSCDDLFYDLSNNAKSNQQQALYFDSMREIRLKREILQKDCLTRLSDSFQKIAPIKQNMAANGMQINNAKASPKVDKLAIVENDVMEIDVALTNMSTRANAAYIEEIHDLQTRLSALFKAGSFVREDNPLLPERLCRMFADNCRAHLDLNIKALIILLKQFERLVLERVGYVYVEINQILADAGICPNISRKVNKKNSSSKLASDANDKLVAQQNRYNIPLSNTYNHHFSIETFKQLFTDIRRSGTAPPDGFKVYSNNSGPFISLAQLADLLSQAQLLVEQDDHYDIEKPHLHDITSKLLKTQSSKEARAVGENEDSIINLVAMFFEFILDDNTIALKLRNQISRLQIPVLKLALQDDTFFSNSSHPARKLINTIAAVGVIYNGDHDLSEDNTYRTIVDVVKTICHQYAFDNQIFAELFPQLEKVVEQEQQRRSTVEKRTAQMELGKSRVKAANKTARTFLVKKLHGKPIPSVARDFLIDHWLNVMVMSLLKFSGNSKQWAAVAQVVDDLVWCCQSDKDDESLQRLRQLQPSLFKRIDAGLNLLGRDSHSIKLELKKIEGLIKQSFEKTDSNSEEETKITETAKEMIKLIRPTNNAKTAIARQQEQFAKISSKSLQQVSNMKLGDWIEYKNAETKIVTRCRLLTKIEPSDNFLFVNRFGVKVLEKSRREIAYDIQQGQISIIDDAPFFERTLAKVFIRLRSQPIPAT